MIRAAAFMAAQGIHMNFLFRADTVIAGIIAFGRTHGIFQSYAGKYGAGNPFRHIHQIKIAKGIIYLCLLARVRL